MGWIVAGNITPSFIEGNGLTGEVCVLRCVFALLIKADNILIFSIFNRIYSDNGIIQTHDLHSYTCLSVGVVCLASFKHGVHL